MFHHMERDGINYRSLRISRLKLLPSVVGEVLALLARPPAIIAAVDNHRSGTRTKAISKTAGWVGPRPLRSPA